MRYKVLVLDLDGTLTNSKKKITDYTKKILLNLQKKEYILYLRQVVQSMESGR